MSHVSDPSPYRKARITQVKVAVHVATLIIVAVARSI